MAEDFDCPTGTCEEDEPRCADIQLGDTIDPNSVAHLERNECNTCPATPPAPVYITVPIRSPQVGYYEQRVLQGYFDCQGNEWSLDWKYAAHAYHGDPHWILPRDLDNTTYRVVPTGSVRGWQCRYVNGQLDDETLNMGTYDFAPSGFGEVLEGILPGGGVNEHDLMDVQPHESNGNYVPNLTKVICG